VLKWPRAGILPGLDQCPVTGDEYIEEMELCPATKTLKKLVEQPAPVLLHVHYEIILDKNRGQAICHYEV